MNILNNSEESSHKILFLEYKKKDKYININENLIYKKEKTPFENKETFKNYYQLLKDLKTEKYEFCVIYFECELECIICNKYYEILKNVSTHRCGVYFPHVDEKDMKRKNEGLYGFNIEIEGSNIVNHAKMCIPCYNNYMNLMLNETENGIKKMNILTEKILFDFWKKGKYPLHYRV